jgi:hypothetical protein
MKCFINNCKIEDTAAIKKINPEKYCLRVEYESSSKNGSKVPLGI